MQLRAIYIIYVYYESYYFMYKQVLKTQTEARACRQQNRTFRFIQHMWEQRCLHVTNGKDDEI